MLSIFASTQHSHLRTVGRFLRLGKGESFWRNVSGSTFVPSVASFTICFQASSVESVRSDMYVYRCSIVSALNDSHKWTGEPVPVLRKGAIELKRSVLAKDNYNFLYKFYELV